MPYERKTTDILVSDKLIDILKEFESESEVAALLLKKRHHKEELVDVPVNFLSVSEQDPTKISYLTQDRIDTMPQEELWTSSRRFQVKPGSFISKIFKNISPREVEKFSNLFRTISLRPKFTFEIVKGENLREYYSYSTYRNECSGSLGNSCMKHDGCQKFFDLYVDNSDILSMLLMVDDEGKLIGRSLLWNFESYRIMDRIYTICDEDFQYYFKQWATKNGYLYKSEQNWSNTLNFESIGNKKQEIKIDIKIKKQSYRLYPYVDTFKFIDIENYTLHNYIPENVPKGNIKTLVGSDGSKFGSDYLSFDDISRVYKHSNEVVYVEYINIRTHQSNVVWSDINNQWILPKDSKYIEEMGDYIFNNENDKFNNNPIIDQRIANLRERRKRRDTFDLRIQNMEYVSSPVSISDFAIIEESPIREEYSDTPESEESFGGEMESASIEMI